MDALKYAHQTLIDKLQRKKSSDVQQRAPATSLSNGQSVRSANSVPPAAQRKPTSAGSPGVNMTDYCDKYDATIRPPVNQSQVNKSNRSPCHPVVIELWTVQIVDGCTAPRCKP